MPNSPGILEWTLSTTKIAQPSSSQQHQSFLRPRYVFADTVGIQLDNCEEMSDTESVCGESSEEEMEDLLEEDIKTEIKDETEDKVSNGEMNGIHNSENLKVS